MIRALLQVLKYINIVYIAYESQMMSGDQGGNAYGQYRQFSIFFDFLLIFLTMFSIKMQGDHIDFIVIGWGIFFWYFWHFSRKLPFLAITSARNTPRRFPRPGSDPTTLPEFFWYLSDFSRIYASQIGPEQPRLATWLGLGFLTHLG